MKGSVLFMTQVLLSFAPKLSLVAVMISACTVIPQITCQESESNTVLRAIEMAKSTERSHWYPAARYLGSKAASNPDLRDRIWNEAQINTLGMKYVRIEPGDFVMGPAYFHPLRPQPAHPVRLTRPFYICVTETTNEHYGILNADHERNERFSPDWESPVVDLNWGQVQAFCKALSAREERVYRLPTEAEWEYVCRAGMPSPHAYCFGDDVEQLSKYAWHSRSRPYASPVALLLPNAWGVYDMHGNVLEFVQDWFVDYARPAPDTITIDPAGPEKGLNHTLRGGEWFMHDVRGCECGFRLPWPLIAINFEPGRPQLRDTVGFRVVRDVETARGNEQ